MSDDKEPHKLDAKQEPDTEPKTSEAPKNETRDSDNYESGDDSEGDAYQSGDDDDDDDDDDGGDEVDGGRGGRVQGRADEEMVRKMLQMRLNAGQKKELPKVTKQWD